MKHFIYLTLSLTLFTSAFAQEACEDTQNELIKGTTFAIQKGKLFYFDLELAGTISGNQIKTISTVFAKNRTRTFIERYEGSIQKCVCVKSTDEYSCTASTSVTPVGFAKDAAPVVNNKDAIITLEEEWGIKEEVVAPIDSLPIIQPITPTDSATIEVIK